MCRSPLLNRDSRSGCGDPAIPKQLWRARSAAASNFTASGSTLNPAGGLRNTPTRKNAQKPEAALGAGNGRVRSECEWRAVERERSSGRAPALCAAQPAQFNRNTIRLRRRPVRCVHGPAQWARGAFLPDVRRRGGHSKIVTIEGLEQNGRLSAVQQAFLDEGALQCGYCTSGMILSATSLLRDKRNPSDDEIVMAMNGNVCRCGTYPRIVAAIKRAAQTMATEPSR